MTVAPNTVSSRQQWDGAGVFYISSGRLAFATTAQSNQGTTVVPCDCTIKQITKRTLASTTATSALLNIGKNGTADNILADHACNGTAAGTEDIPTSGLATGGATLTKGDAIAFQNEAATAAGAVSVTIVCVPTVQE